LTNFLGDIFPSYEFIVLVILIYYKYNHYFAKVYPQDG
jgi:hypothetical protein